MSNSQRKVPWRMTRRTMNLFFTFWETAALSPEGSSQFEEALEGLKMLPGYPNTFGDDVEFQPILIHDATNLRPS